MAKKVGLICVLAAAMTILIISSMFGALLTYNKHAPMVKGCKSNAVVEGCDTVQGEDLRQNGNEIKFYNEEEPNDAKDQANEVFAGDIISGQIGQGADSEDWYKIFLQDGSTLRVIINHAIDEGLYAQIIHPNGTVLRESIPNKPIDTLYLTADDTTEMDYYYIKIIDVLTFSGSGFYTLEIDSDYEIYYYSPDVGYYVQMERYDVNSTLIDLGQIKSYVYNSSGDINVPTWAVGDNWNFSTGKFNGFNTEGEAYTDFIVVGEESVGGKQCYKLKVHGYMRLTMSMMGITQTTTVTKDGYQWHTKDTLAIAKEDTTITMTMEMSSTRTRQEFDFPTDDDFPTDGGMDMSIKQEISTELTYNPPMQEIKFPLNVGDIWSEEYTISGTFNVKMYMYGSLVADFGGPVSAKIARNYKVLGQETKNINGKNYETYKIQRFFGRYNNNEWDTPDFNLIAAVHDNYVPAGVPYGFFVILIGYNGFDGTATIKATSTSGSTVAIAPLTLEPGEAAGVGIDTFGLNKGTYTITVTATSGGSERSIEVPFTVTTDPEFELIPLDPWVTLPTGVDTTVFLGLAVEPVNGFGADVTLSVNSPKGITATVDAKNVKAPYIALMKVDISSSLAPGDYSIIVSGVGGGKEKTAEFVITLISIPDFKINLSMREVVYEPGDKVVIEGYLEAINGLDLSAGGMIEVSVTPYDEDIISKSSIEITSISSSKISFKVTLDMSGKEGNYSVYVTGVSVGSDQAHTKIARIVTQKSAGSGDSGYDGDNGNNGAGDGKTDSGAAGAEGILGDTTMQMVIVVMVIVVVVIVAISIVMRKKKSKQGPGGYTQIPMQPRDQVSQPMDEGIYTPPPPQQQHQPYPQQSQQPSHSPTAQYSHHTPQQMQMQMPQQQQSQYQPTTTATTYQGRSSIHVIPRQQGPQSQYQHQQQPSHHPTSQNHRQNEYDDLFDNL